MAIIEKTTEKIMDELDGDKIVRRTEFDSDTLEIENIYKNFNIDSDRAKSWAENFTRNKEGKLEEVKPQIV